jgi:hypothetical protein
MFIALLATSLVLGGALAHALELSSTITVSREDYLVAQQIYLAAGTSSLICWFWNPAPQGRPLGHVCSARPRGREQSRAIAAIHWSL